MSRTKSYSAPGLHCGRAAIERSGYEATEVAA